jgi:hypothetical protein
MNRLGPGVERALHTDAEKLPKILAGAHVIHVAAVTDLFTVAIRLRFIFVVHPVEPAVEVILVTAPGNTRHHVDAIAPFAPRLDARGQSGVHSVNDGHIRTQIGRVAVGLTGLEAGAFEALARVLWWEESRERGRRQHNARCQSHGSHRGFDACSGKAFDRSGAQPARRGLRPKTTTNEHEWTRI